MFSCSHPLQYIAVRYVLALRGYFFTARKVAATGKWPVTGSSQCRGIVAGGSTLKCCHILPLVQVCRSGQPKLNCKDEQVLLFCIVHSCWIEHQPQKVPCERIAMFSQITVQMCQLVYTMHISVCHTRPPTFMGHLMVAAWFYKS